MQLFCAPLVIAISALSNALDIPLQQWDLSASSDFDVSYPATVPTTVAAALELAGSFGREPLYHSTNLRDVNESMFDTPWYFRTCASIPELVSTDRVNLEFQGLKPISLHCTKHSLSPTANELPCIPGCVYGEVVNCHPHFLVIYELPPPFCSCFEIDTPQTRES